MGLLDDTAIFTAIVEQGGFSHAAKYLGLSNGLISRRIAKLEKQLAVTLFIRTTRQIQLTIEGELFWQHSKRIQKEMESALALIRMRSDAPKGEIKISAPLFFGKQVIMPICAKFLKIFKEISLDINLTNAQLDPIKDKIDLIIRGAGYLSPATLKDSSFRERLLIAQKIGLYASPEYLNQYGIPKNVTELARYHLINYIDDHTSTEASWLYQCQGKKAAIKIKPALKCNEMGGVLSACISGFGIGKFTDLAVQYAVKEKALVPLLTQYEWGHFNVYAIYAPAQLPKRTRLLLDFMQSQLRAQSLSNY